MHGTGEKLEQQERADEELVQAVREGDRAAFAELWQRHHRAGLGCARGFTRLDADDVVAEAFLRIYQRTVTGGGPRGSFRPYLYTTIRNLAATWGTRSAKSVCTDSFDDLPMESAEAPVERHVDRDLTIEAFQSLPQRWQTVLWLTEVEGRDPQDVAPIMGMSPNGVAALAYRAREGLRKAWLQAHVSDERVVGECAWVTRRLGERSRRGLTALQAERIERHLGACAHCADVAEQVDEVGSRLAMALLPLIVGGVAGGVVLALGAAAAGTGGTAVATTLASGATSGAATSSATTAVAAGSTATAAVAGGAAAGGAAATGASAASIAAAIAIAASTAAAAVVGVSVTTHDGASAATASVAAPASSSAARGAASVPVSTTPAPVDPADVSAATRAQHPSSSTLSGDATPATDADTDGTNTVTRAVTGLVDGTTGTVEETVHGTTGVVDGTVRATTGAVNGLVDDVLPDGSVGSAVTGTVGGVTGLVGGVTDDLTNTTDDLTDGLTGTVGGLVGGLLGG